jgi:hypothetical protein
MLWLAAQVDAKRVKQAQQVMDQVGYSMREILRDNHLLMLPVLPGPPPGRAAPQPELAAWEAATLQLASIAALGGLPQVCGMR